MRYDLAQICSTAPTLPRPLQAYLAHLQATEVYPLRRGSTTELRRSRPFSPQPRTPPIETRPSSATKAGFNFRSRMHMRVARIRYGKSRWLRTPSVEAGEPEGGWLCLPPLSQKAPPLRDTTIAQAAQEHAYLYRMRRMASVPIERRQERPASQH